MPCPIKRKDRCARLCASALTSIAFSIFKVASVDELYLQPFYMHDDYQPTHQQEGCNWIPNQRWPLHCKKKKTTKKTTFRLYYVFKAGVTDMGSWMGRSWNTKLKQFNYTSSRHRATLTCFKNFVCVNLMNMS